MGEDGVAALGGELLGQLLDVLAEDRGEQGGGLSRGVGRLALLGREELGVGRDVVRVDAGGEGDAPAVGDLAALGGDRVLQVAVLLGLGGVRVGVDGLDLEEPRHEGEHDQGQPEADEPQPGARAAQAQGTRRLAAPGGAARRGARPAGLGARGAAGRAAGAGRAGYAAARRILGRHCVTCRGSSGAGCPAPRGRPRGPARARTPRARRKDPGAGASGSAVASALGVGLGLGDGGGAVALVGLPRTVPSGPRKAGLPQGPPTSRGPSSARAGSGRPPRSQRLRSSVTADVIRLTSAAPAPAIVGRIHQTRVLSPPPRTQRPGARGRPAAVLGPVDGNSRGAARRAPARCGRLGHRAAAAGAGPRPSRRTPHHVADSLAPRDRPAAGDRTPTSSSNGIPPPPGPQPQLTHGHDEAGAGPESPQPTGRFAPTYPQASDTKR
ncbi:hypothetical protein SCALM49S_02069 [Streptomyces californicus]